MFLVLDQVPRDLARAFGMIPTGIGRMPATPAILVRGEISSWWPVANEDAALEVEKVAFRDRRVTPGRTTPKRPGGAAHA